MGPLHDEHDESAEPQGVGARSSRGGAAAPSGAESAGEGADAIDLLGSPIEGAALHRLFVIGGPLVLFVTIMLSLWVSHWHLRHSAVVQVETQWRSGQTLALRAQVVAEEPGPLEGASGQAWAQQNGGRLELTPLAAAGEFGVVQGTFAVPAELALGPAQLHVELQAVGADSMHEVVDVQVVDAREPRPPVSTVSGSTLQYADDTQPQPPGMRIDVRPIGRLLSEFDNTLLVRVLLPDGRPWSGPVEVVLVDGEFGGARGDPDRPPVLVRESTDELGLLAVSGPLTSELIRIEARVLDREDASRVRAQRRVRLVSYAGSISLQTPTSANAAGELEIEANALRHKRPIFIDVHAPDGTWIDTFQPPLSAAEPPRVYMLDEPVSGLLQFEAYHFTTVPGESTAVSTVQVLPEDDDPADSKSLRPLVQAQLDALDVPRVEHGFDPKLERAYLGVLQDGTWSSAEVASARRFLLGTLPVRLYGAPTVLITRERNLADIRAAQRAWTLGLRTVLLGGGGLFLLAMTLTMVRSHTRAARATMTELQRLTEGEARVEIRAHVDRARRAALVRGLGMVAIMAAGLVLATVVLESLLWVF